MSLCLYLFVFTQLKTDLLFSIQISEEPVPLDVGLLIDSLHPHEVEQQPPGFEERFLARIQAYTAGYDRALSLVPHLSTAVGGQVTFYRKPEFLTPIYGGSPVGVVVFVRLRTGGSHAHQRCWSALVEGRLAGLSRSGQPQFCGFGQAIVKQRSRGDSKR